MNLYYANGTPIINSLKVTSEVPLDPRLYVQDMAERDALVTNHIAYDLMRVHVKSNDTIYIYYKDTNTWEQDNKFTDEEKDKLGRIVDYLTDLRINITNEDVILTEVSYNAATNTTNIFDNVLPLVSDEHNGLISPEIKNWIDSARGLSNTGTISQTWQLQKSNIDTRLDPNGGVIIKNVGGKLEVRNSTDTDYAPLTVNDLVIKGNVTQEGDTFITEAETVEIKDNMLLLNRGETGSGVTSGISGLEIDRGNLPNYYIVFDESSKRFKAGEENDLWCLTLRDDDADMLDGYFTSWSSDKKRLETTNIVPTGINLYFGDQNNYITRSSTHNGLLLHIGAKNLHLYDDNTDLVLDTISNFKFDKRIIAPKGIINNSDRLDDLNNSINAGTRSFNVHEFNTDTSNSPGQDIYSNYNIIDGTVYTNCYTSNIINTQIAIGLSETSGIAYRKYNTQTGESIVPWKFLADTQWVNENLHYKTDLDDNLEMLEDHGGLKEGTKVSDLEKMTFNEIFDEILFPTIFPTYIAPKVTLSLISTATTPTIQEIGTIGTSVPVIGSFSHVFDPGAIMILDKKQANRAGDETNESFIFINGDVSNTTFPTVIPNGTITYRYRCYYEQGPQPLTNKGDAVDSPLPAGYVDSNIITIYGVYPYFTNKDNLTTFTKLPLTTSTTLSNLTFKPEGPERHAFKLPATYTLTKVEMLNTLSGKFEDIGTARWAVTTETISVQGNDVEYKVYTRNDSGLNGECVYNFIFSK